MSFFSHTKPTLAIDIASDVIHIVHVDKNKQVRYIKSIPTPANAFINNRITDPATIATALQAAIQEIPSVPKDVVFGVPDAACFSKVFTLDAKTDEKTISSKIIELARTEIPLEFEKTAWDYIPQKTDVSLQSFLYVSADREVIKPYQTIAKICDLSIRAIDANILALSRSLLDTPNDKKLEGSATLILSGNIPHTTMNVFDAKNNLVFSGIIPQTNIVTIVETSALQTIIHEVMQVIDHVKRELSLTIDTVLVIGELALTPNIETLISVPGVVVRIGNPTKTVSSSPLLHQESHLSQYAIALGLSLHDQNQKELSASINLLGHESPETRPVTPTPGTEVTKTEKNIPYKKIFAYVFLVATFITLGIILYYYLIVPLSTR